MKKYLIYNKGKTHSSSKRPRISKPINVNNIAGEIYLSLITLPSTMIEVDRENTPGGEYSRSCTTL